MVAVDGSDPEALGGVWLPRTAVGEGDEPSGDGGAEAPGLLDETGDADDGPDCAVVGDGVVAAVDGGAGVVVAGALCAAIGERFGGLGEELAVAWFAAGLSATPPVDDAANTAAPSATRPRIATIGTSPIRLPSGESCRHLGQKPETAVNTLPQFRQRTGRRVRATAWLVAFFVRDRF